METIKMILPAATISEEEGNTRNEVEMQQQQKQTRKPNQ